MNDNVRHIHARKGERIKIHRWQPHNNRRRLPERHVLNPLPHRRGMDYGWIWVILGGAAVALVIAYPAILVALGLGGVAVAWLASN